MLTKIEINNFKSFNETFIFDLSETNSFVFNQECIKNNIVNKAIIYGHNSCGKSNLALAIFDIVSHISDKRSAPEKYTNYLNANSNKNTARFKFEFKFDENTLSYEYTKNNYDELIFEKILINNDEFCSIDRDNSYILNTVAIGTENLKKDLSNSNISIVKYINMNAVLENNEKNAVFTSFINFVNHMLLFRNLDDRFYIGLEQDRHKIEEDIIEHDNLKDFETFLNDAGIKCNLKIRDDSFNNKGIDFVFNNRTIPLFKIASSGTISLTLFYFWYQRLKERENCSFLFIDEFDAFYHHTLSRTIIEKLKEICNTQVILTTHNTSIISNDLLRPDCYFLMDEQQIRPLTKCTDRELREGHNIEKMYRANSFE